MGGRWEIQSTYVFCGRHCKWDRELKYYNNIKLKQINTSPSL